jgi:predicted nuclease of predicted toxin-antitoxin system
MKLLFDQNISHRLLHQTKDFLPESKQVRELGLENYSDKQIWEFAKENEFTIVTFDVDFYDFSVVWGHPPKIIWIRTYKQTTKNLEQILRKYVVIMKEFINNKELACLEIKTTSVS